jgi:predicted transport protein
MNIETMLEANETSKALFEVLRAMVEEIGAVTVQFTKSQVAFRRKRAFAWAWIPAQYLKRRGLAPLVLSLSLPYRDPSSRWKEVIEPSSGKFMHHLELWDPVDLDAEVKAWLRKAWEEAG